MMVPLPNWTHCVKLFPDCVKYAMFFWLFIQEVIESISVFRINISNHEIVIILLRKKTYQSYSWSVNSKYIGEFVSTLKSIFVQGRGKGGKREKGEKIILLNALYIYLVPNIQNCSF